jgi:hypothetical protein
VISRFAARSSVGIEDADAPAMKKMLVGILLMIVAITACAPSDIQASDYDQSCAKDDDCVAVSELHTRGSDCIRGCGQTAINKKDKAQFDEDVASEEDRCRGMASPFCDVTGTPACVESRCTIRSP